MLFAEWNLDDAIEISREEGFEDGLEKGLEQGLEKGREEGEQKIIDMLKSGKSTEEIIKLYQK